MTRGSGKYIEDVMAHDTWVVLERGLIEGGCCNAAVVDVTGALAEAAT
jgi:hypothetical protein